MATKKPQEITLSDGSILELPEDISDDEARVRVQQAEEQLKSSSADTGGPAPVDDSHWYDPLVTGAKEFGVGGVKGVAGLPDVIPNLANTGVAVSRAANPYVSAEVKPEEQFRPWVGGAETVEKAIPTTPGYEGVRETGELYGGSAAGGAAAGGALGAFLGPEGAVAGAGAGALEGLRSATFSLAGEKLGELADYVLGNKDRRFETLGAIGGAWSPLIASPASNIMTRSKFATRHTPDIAAAAARQNIEPSLALLGGSKTVPESGRLFRRQVEGLQNLVEANKEAIRGGQPAIEEAKGAIQSSIQEKAGAAAKEARNRISTEQEALTTSIGGGKTMHDARPLLNDLRTQLKNGELPPLAERQMNALITEVEGAMSPKDPALDAQLRSDLEAARQIRDNKMGMDRNKKQQAARDYQNIQQQIDDNMGISDDKLRKIASQQKELLAAEGKTTLSHDVLAPYKESAETIRQQASGKTPEEWAAIQQRMEPLYKTEEMLSKREPDPFESGDYGHFFGPSGDITPGRLSNIEQMGGNVQSELAAQYGLKTTPNGVFDPASGQWWGTLDEAARALRHRGDPGLQQKLADAALLSRNLPRAPYEGGPTTGEQAAGAIVKTAALSGHPLAIFGYPTLASTGAAGLRAMMGINRAKGMMGNTAQDIAHLLATSAVVAPQGVTAMQRNRGER